MRLAEIIYDQYEKEAEDGRLGVSGNIIKKQHKEIRV